MIARRLISLSPALSLAVGLLCANPASADAVAQPSQTFGPGKVSCQLLGKDDTDCLLSSSRITSGPGNEASFSLETLPPGARALFRKWCLQLADECTVTIQGQRESRQATRLATVTSLRWQRPLAPKNETAAAP